MVCLAGKGVEDKRGESVESKVRAGGWLYLGGRAVQCSRAMEVAAMLSSINPSISATADSVELGQLQQVLDLYCLRVLITCLLAVCY